MLQKLVKTASQSTNGGGGGKSHPRLSVIGPDVRIVGDIITQGEMQIDGQVEGDITCQVLVVGEGARITGEVNADSVRVHGELTGKIHAVAVVIAKSARVVGDISHDSLEIEAGAHMEGHLLRKGSAPRKAEPAAEKPAKKGQQAPAALPAPAETEVQVAEAQPAA